MMAGTGPIAFKILYGMNYMNWRVGLSWSLDA